MMIRIIAGLLLTLCAFPAYSIDISGHYRCRGDDFLNKSTFDEPTVVKKTGDTFLFIWNNKGVNFYGTSILLDQTLTTVFWTPSDPNSHGVVTYKILPNGDLKGKWAVKEGTVTGDEYCEKQP